MMLLFGTIDAVASELLGGMRMKYSIAICDDSKTDAALVQSFLLEWAKQRGTEVEIEVFPSAESFLFRYDEYKAFDILLFDVEMSGMDGVSAARKVRRENEAVQIVFITGYSDYIAEGYDVAALHYLMKPLNKEKFFSVLNRAAQKITQNERCICFESGGEMLRIPVYEIHYLEVFRNYVTVHAKREYTVKRTLSEFEQELGSGFHRIGRAVIVNLKFVAHVTKTEVQLSDGTVLPLPRGAYELLNRAIIAHL